VGRYEGVADGGELVEEGLGDGELAAGELAAGDRLAVGEDAEGSVERFVAKWPENLSESCMLESVALELEAVFDAEVEPGHVLELGTEVEVEVEAETQAEVGMGRFVMERNAAAVVVCY
jgi:hypothetical protein